MTTFAGKVGLVTGAASGIGRASAVGFASLGAAVGVLDLDADGAQETARLIETAGGRALAVSVDVGDDEAVRAAVDQVAEAFGGLDFAHNNAGVPGSGLAPLADVATAEWDAVLRINLSGVFHCMKHEIPHLVDRGGGAIVNTASTAGLVAVDLLPAYVASKHGVVGLTKSAALDYGPQGIRVNAVCPGLTRTPMSEGAVGTDDAAFAAIAAQIPLRRVGRPEDIAAGAIWLCSDDASFATGQALSLDGGGAKINLSVMDLGVHVEHIGLQLGLAELVQTARTAEELGFASVWTAESFGADAASTAAWIGAVTTTIKVGGALWQIPARTAAATAMTAATIDQLSGGRLILGLGPSSPRIAEDWHGQPYGRQLQRTRDYFEAVRVALRGEDDGRPYRLAVAPCQDPIPLYLGAVGPRNTALAGEIADGWIPTFFSPEHAAHHRALLAEGAARTGRSVDDVAIVPVVGVRIDEDLAAARDALRPYLAIFVAAGGYSRDNSYARLMDVYGFGGAATAVQDHYEAGRTADAARAIPDGLVDLLTLCGPKERVAEGLEAFRAAGADTLIAMPLPTGPEDLTAQLRALADAPA